MTMSIRDNGIGIPPSNRNRAGSFGLMGIEERVKILGGSFSLSSGPDIGTTIVVSIPVGFQQFSAPELLVQGGVSPPVQT